MDNFFTDVFPVICPRLGTIEVFFQMDDETIKEICKDFRSSIMVLYFIITSSRSYMNIRSKIEKREESQYRGYLKKKAWYHNHPKIHLIQDKWSSNEVVNNTILMDKRFNLTALYSSTKLSDDDKKLVLNFQRLLNKSIDELNPSE